MAGALDSVRESESHKRRPAVVVSNDRANATAMRLGGGVITVVPVTSNTTSVYPFQASLSTGSGLTVDSKAQAERMRSVAAQRLLNRVGRCSAAELAALDDALRLHLNM